MSVTAFLADVEDFPESNRTKSTSSGGFGEFLSWKPYVSTTRSVAPTQPQIDERSVQSAD
jgi:hypothetical protein